MKKYEILNTTHPTFEEHLHVLQLCVVMEPPELQDPTYWRWVGEIERGRRALPAVSSHGYPHPDDLDDCHDPNYYEEIAESLECDMQRGEWI